MGYYTQHTMSLENATSEQEEAIIDRLREMEIIGEVLDEDLSCYQESKWYDEEEDMKELSKEFPDVHFTVHGEGEENGDIWDHHYLGGKIQRCGAEIIIPPFDPEKLAEY